MDYLPGYLQGITRVLISHPFDLIRLNLQMNNYKNIYEFYKNNNIKNCKTLYKGISIPLLIVPIDRAVQYRIFELFNKNNVNSFISGGICGIISSLITMPFNYICNTFILSKENHSLQLYIKKLSNDMHLNNSKKILFRGFFPEIFRSIIGSSIYLGVYGSMRNRFGNNDYNQIINSFLAGVSVWSITYPIETIKIEKQVTNDKINIILKRRIANYGLLNLWKGVMPMFIKSIPSSVAGMYVYEKTRKIIA